MVKAALEVYPSFDEQNAESEAHRMATLTEQCGLSYELGLIDFKFSAEFLALGSGGEK